MTWKKLRKIVGLLLLMYQMSKNEFIFYLHSKTQLKSWKLNHSFNEILTSCSKTIAKLWLLYREIMVIFIVSTFFVNLEQKTNSWILETLRY